MTSEKDAPAADETLSADDPFAGLTPEQVAEGKERAEAFKRSLDLKPLPKRFYDTVSCAPFEDRSGYGVWLDQRQLMTPGRTALQLETASLAEAIAGEWRTQGERIDAATMPLTRFANTSQDRVLGREAEIVDEIVSFAGSDLLCYRAERPAPLVAQQAAAWDPVLTWAEQDLGARLRVVTGVMFVEQPEAALSAIHRHTAPYGAANLTAIHNMTTLTGSCVLALSVAAEVSSPEAAWTAAHVDEDWQISQWGEDFEASARREHRTGEFLAAARYLALARTA